jgi:hypothetical protein
MSFEELCSDPADLLLLVLTSLGKPCQGNVSHYMYCVRVFNCLIIDFAEMAIISSVLSQQKDNMGLSVVLIFLHSFGIIAACILISQVLVVICSVDASNEQIQKQKNKLFVVFKTINIFFVAVVGACTIYVKAQIHLNNNGHIFLIVCLGLDAFLDPIELIIGSIIMCKS